VFVYPKTGYENVAYLVSGSEVGFASVKPSWWHYVFPSR